MTGYKPTLTSFPLILRREPFSGSLSYIYIDRLDQVDTNLFSYSGAPKFKVQPTARL